MTPYPRTLAVEYGRQSIWCCFISRQLWTSLVMCIVGLVYTKDTVFFWQNVCVWSSVLDTKSISFLFWYLFYIDFRNSPEHLICNITMAFWGLVQTASSYPPIGQSINNWGPSAKICTQERANYLAYLVQANTGTQLWGHVKYFLKLSWKRQLANEKVVFVPKTRYEQNLQCLKRLALETGFFFWANVDD